MLTSNYEEALDRVLQLTPDEQVRLLEELELVVRRRATVRPKHSITELRGLGKEIWQKIDVEKYIEEERNSWDG